MDISPPQIQANDRGNATEPRDDGSVSSLSDGEADRATAPAPAPASAGTTLSGVRGGKYSSWPRSEALGVALVVLRRAEGVGDVRSAMLDFLENGLVLSHTFEHGGISFQANLPAMVCWSCRRRISGAHDSNLEFFTDDDVPSCDAEVEVMRSCLCPPEERSGECTRLRAPRPGARPRDGPLARTRSGPPPRPVRGPQIPPYEWCGVLRFFRSDRGVASAVAPGDGGGRLGPQQCLSL